MRRFLVRFSESEASNHTPSLADFTTTTPEFKFSVHTGGLFFREHRGAVDLLANRSPPCAGNGNFQRRDTPSDGRFRKIEAGKLNALGEKFANRLPKQSVSNAAC
jgi:hypothetical protein